MTKLPERIRILHLEDLASDADLIERELKKGKLRFDKLVVDNKPDFEKALTTFYPDIILSDHSMPSFNSKEALSIAKRVLKDVPFILITSAMPDEYAVAILQQGACDYILKDRLQRLNAAIENALEKFLLEKEKQRFMATIERNEKRFRAMIEKSVDMITLSDAEGKLLYGSPSIGHLFGYNPTEFLNVNSTEYVHPDDIQYYLLMRENLLKHPGQSTYMQLRLRHNNGAWIWCESTMSNMLAEPDIHAVVSNFRDISEKKNLELQKELDKDYLNALINNTQDLMWSVDLNFNLLTSNEPFQKIIENISGHELKKGTSLFSLGFDEELNNQFKSLFSRAIKGETFTELIYTSHPVESWSDVSFNPIKHNNEIIGCACFSRNVTESKKAQIDREKLLEDLIQRSKNLEQFAYIISHNLRSPVAHILGISNLLKTDLSKEDRAKGEQYIYDAAEKLDQVTRDLNKILQIKSEITELKQMISFKDVLGEVMTSLTYTVSDGLEEIRHDFSGAEQIVSIRSYIQSIFYNLISNSIKYKQVHKTLIVEIKSEIKGNRILLSFKDNGSGIDLTKNKDLIFGLYKRFHAGIEGKGAGLFMVKTQVESLGGKISVTSEVGRGSEFTIELPVLT